MVGNSLDEEEIKEMVQFLRHNTNVFTYQPYDMPGIDAKVMCHKLYIDLGFRLIRQKPMRTAS